MHRLAIVPAFVAVIVVSANVQAKVTRDYPEVVALYSELSIDGHTPGAARCTGTFIRPRLLLTAAHCVRHFNIEATNGHAFRATDMAGHPVPDQTASPQEVYILEKKWWGTKKIHPTRVFVSEHAVPVDYGNLNLSYIQQDLAVLEFPNPVPGTRDFAVEAPPEGEPVAMVGFGEHGRGTADGACVGCQLPPRHFGQNFISTVGDDRIVSLGSALTCENPGPYTLDWAICPGDSGGPLIDANTGRVLGVASTSGVEEYGSDRHDWRKHSVFVNLTSPEAQEFLASVLRQSE